MNSDARADAVFASDVHLSDAHPKTTDAFLRFIDETVVGGTGRLYLLGDLFEYWAGDDDLPEPLAAGISERLREVAASGVETFFMAGNRDFLIGAAFAREAGLTLLPDPTPVTIGGLDLVLSHGDELCTDDVDYQRFRTMVREPGWQAEFLAKPLEDRRAVIAGVRMQSEAAKRDKAASIMDVNPDAVRALLDAYPDAVLIHGHTHRPACHRYGPRTRWVLTDWDAEATPPRGGGLVLREGRLEVVEA